VVQKRLTFTDRMRASFRWLLNPIAAFLSRVGVRPNTVTMVGLIGTVGSAALIATGHLTWAGLVLLLMGPVDALDGALARLRNEASDWGAFVDSVTDRYSELFIFGGFILYYMLNPDPIGIILAYLSAAGSILTSYIKARADAQKLDANVGVLTRVERYIVLIPGLIFNLPMITLALVAILANFTALQRIARARSDALRRKIHTQE
jgi:CDP-diacylglycerol--glycerol-3-phosphate 3-phosphatidyltransferase